MWYDNDMNCDLHPSWTPYLNEYFATESFQKLSNLVDQAYLNNTVYPKAQHIFAAFNDTPLDTIKVIIIGQDPYHNEGQAHGLAFSVPEGITPPPSLKNIYKEIEQDLGITKDMTKGDLSSWAKQGVLLLNSVLTVNKHQPGSHQKKGWEAFTDYVIKKISDKKEHCVFLLWGNYAKEKGLQIDETKHLVLRSAHPSPFSAYNGFFGNKHFSQTNSYLKKHGKTPIDW